MTIHVPDYWPFNITPGKVRNFHYIDPTGQVAPWTSAFAIDGNELAYVDSNGQGQWQDTWFLQVTAEGVAEVADWYPETDPILEALYGKFKKVVYSAPILWGGDVEVPSVLNTTAKVNAVGCTPPFASSGSAQQVVSFEKVGPFMEYPDVLQLAYSQSWNSETPTGARYWLAKGVGPVAVQWLGYNTLAVTEPIAYATVSGG